MNAQLYLPLQQPYAGRPVVGMTLLARARAGGDTLQTLLASVPGVQIERAESLQEAAVLAAGLQRFLAMMLALFASLALLAAVMLSAMASRSEAALLGHLLFGVGALDPWVWAAAAGLVGACALAAAALPAVRASATDPAQALRYE